MERWTLIVGTALALAVTAAGVTGGIASAIVLSLGAMVVGAAAWAAAGGADAYLTRLLLLGLATRALFAIVLHLVLVGRGTGGALFLDDAGYVLAATELARAWRGIPVSEAGRGLITDPSVANAYVVWGAGVFWTLGENVLALKLVNTTLGVLQAALAYRIMRNVGSPGARLAALAILVFPSLVLWSALALKDTYAVTAMLVAVWAASEFQRSGRWWAWIVTPLAMLAIRDVRVYVFTILALAWPMGSIVASRSRRSVASVATVAVAAALLLSSPGSASLLSPSVFSLTAYVRSAMAQGAGSAYVEPPPIAQAEPGELYRVEVVGAVTSSARAALRHELPVGGQLVVEGVPMAREPVRPSVQVRTGDVVLMAERDAEPRTQEATDSDRTAALPVVRVVPGGWNVIAARGEVPDRAGTIGVGQAITANLTHLPYGMWFLATAPVPLAARTATDLMLIPEMLLWYTSLVLAAVGGYSIVRSRDPRFTFGLLTFVAIVLVLSLAEGNLGTLVRHRAMLIPFVVIMAAAGLSTLATRTRLAPLLD